MTVPNGCIPVQNAAEQWKPMTEVAHLRHSMILFLAAALLSAAQPACHASSALPGNALKIKAALYLDVGCKGGGVIHWAQLLKSSPDVECDFIDAADVQAGKLGGYDVLVMPGGSG